MWVVDLSSTFLNAFIPVDLKEPSALSLLLMSMSLELFALLSYVGVFHIVS